VNERKEEGMKPEEREYCGTRSIRVTAWKEDLHGKPGYGVRYRDGYTAWCPEREFLEVYKFASSPSSDGPDAKDYYGTKRITAWPEQKDGKLGFGVRYADGYTSWSPLDAFNDAYHPITAMPFGHALCALKAGGRVARAGWNGKGMWLAHVTGWTFNVMLGPVDNIPTARSLPFLVMRTAQGDFVPWLASQTDILANDWMILVEPLPAAEGVSP
jgi:hypothetical protein